MRNPNRERIVLCGSSRFMDAHQSEMKRLTLEGHVVIGMGMFGHKEAGFDMGGQVKKDLDDLHLDKIDLATRVHVVNQLRFYCKKCKEWQDSSHVVFGQGMGKDVCPKVHCNTQLERLPYVGESTRAEIVYARKKHKKITWMHAPLGKVFRIKTSEVREYVLTYEIPADSVADQQAAVDLVLGQGAPEPLREELKNCRGETLIKAEEV